MNEFLKSVKADLLDRRLLPLVALVGLALAGRRRPTRCSAAARAPTPHAAAALAVTTRR